MTRTLEFYIDAQHDGADVRFYVRKVLGLSARVLTALKYSGEMQRNGVLVRSTEVLHTGDVLTLTLFEEAEQYEAAGVMPPVLFENEDFLILDKPSAMPIYPTPGHDRDSVLNAVATKCNAEGFPFRPLYRLDRDTTGVLVLAKNHFAAGANLEKTYRAVCEGVLPEEGVIEKSIGLLPGHKVQRTTGIGDRAVTKYKRLRTDGVHSLAEFSLLTGRTHQIRVHMASVGHPVAGDDLYGGSRDCADRQMLLCASVHVTCPAVGADFSVNADFSDEQKRLFPNLL